MVVIFVPAFVYTLFTSSFNLITQLECTILDDHSSVQTFEMDHLSEVHPVLRSPNRVGHNEVIGVCRTGPEAEGLGRDHWNEMLAYPRKPITHWHALVEVPETSFFLKVRGGTHKLRRFFQPSHTALLQRHIDLVTRARKGPPLLHLQRQQLHS